MWTELHFIRPWWLAALPIGIGAILFLWPRLAHSNAWQRVCDAHLLPHLIESQSAKHSQFGRWHAFVLWLLASVALAGPSWEKLPLPLASSAAGRVLVLDLSRSMDSTDIKPSRLVRARFKLTDLVRSGVGQQQGLVVFANDAFIVAPLTTDSATLVNLIPALDTTTVPIQGSRADRGLRLAAQLIDNAGLTRADIILITDTNNDLERTIATAASLRQQGKHVSVLAVGTTDGAPIRTTDGGLLKDSRGQIVIAAIDPTQLSQIAASGGGHYTALSVDPSDIAILNTATSLLGHVAAIGDDNQGLTADLWLDRGPWLLLPMLFLAALSFRRGWILSLPLLALLLPQPTQAYDWRRLWQRPEQLAASDFAAGDFERSAQSSKPVWQGASRYRLDDFDGAIESYGALDDAVGQYNLGNALAHAGRLEQAIAAYANALQLAPEMADAEFNKQLLEQLLQQKQQQQKAQQQGQQNEPENKQEKPDQEQSSDSAAESQNTGSDGGESESERQSEAANEQQQASDSTDSESNPSANQADSITADQQTDENSPAASKPQDPSDSQQQQDQQVAKNEPEHSEHDEQQQALAQWLRKIPDDPGGLLRRKFLLQQQQRLRAESPRQNDRQAVIQPW